MPQDDLRDLVHKLIIDLEAARREFRLKFRRHDSGLECLKQNTEEYIPLLKEIEANRQRRRERYEKLLIVAAAVILTAVLTFVGYAVWLHFLRQVHS